VEIFINPFYLTQVMILYNMGFISEFSIKLDNEIAFSIVLV